MTNHNVLYTQAQTKLAARPIGRFMLSDLLDNPPANLGKKFRNDVVVNKRYPNVKRVGADGQSVIYEKF